MDKKLIISGAILACLAIILGAFGAHSLKTILTPETLQSFEVGVRYQMYHALTLVFIGLSHGLPKSVKSILFHFFFWGILLFSGSIYILSFKDFMSFPIEKIALVTPLGGMLFIVGWIVFTVKIIRLKSI